MKKKEAQNFEKQLPNPFYKESPSNQISSFFESMEPKRWVKDDKGVL